MSNWLDKRVVVTGGAGFIGKHLVQELIRRGAEVVVYDDESTGNFSHLPPSSKLLNVHGCVLDKSHMHSIFMNPDYVFHLASIVGMRLAHKDNERTYKISTIGTKNVLEVWPNANFVLASSSSVYGDYMTEWSSEDDEVSIESLRRLDGERPGYSQGKFEMERIGRDAALAGYSVSIVRPFNVVGPGQVSSYGMVIPSFLERALSGRELVVYGDGTQTRCFTWVFDFIDALLKLCELRKSWGLLNIGSTQEISILEAAESILTMTGSSSRIRFEPFGVSFPGRKDVLKRRPNIAKLESLIPNISWKSFPEIISNLTSEGLLRSDKGITLAEQRI